MATEIKTDNCIVCAGEYAINELHGVALSTVNITRFKICDACLKQADPADDYREVRGIVSNFLLLDQKLDK